MKYDDASWHYGGEFPADLTQEAGATHIAMFVAWCVLNGLGGDLHHTECASDTARLAARQVTPARWFIAACDEKFTDEDLTDEGNAFAADYYGVPGDTRSNTANYLADYEMVFPEASSLYAVPDSWDAYDRIAPAIARRLMRWRAKRSKPSWLRWI